MTEKMRKEVTDQLLKIYSNDTKKIEESIYNFSLNLAKLNDVDYAIEDIYNNKVDNIISLLINNDYLIDGIKTKKLKPETIGFMSYKELNPNKFKSISHLEDVEIKGSDKYICRKCSMRNTTITQKQTRAADEAPTIIITCNNCNHKWKI